MTLGDALKRVVGDANFSDSSLDRMIYSRDASEAKGSASEIVWPTSVAEISQVIHIARRSNATIVPRGAGTGLSGGAVPHGSAIVVDMSKMRNIIEVGEGFAIAEAGVVLEELNNAISGQFFPIQAESREAATIGGMIAVNASGIRVMEYGRMADWVEEVTIIDGEGKCLTLKGPAVKHVCGMEGTTGIIISARLKLIRKPGNRIISLMKFNTLTAMEEKLAELKKSVLVKNIEFLNEAVSAMMALGERNHLIVEFEGGTGFLTHNETEALWESRESLPGMMREKHYTITEDVHIPDSSMAHFLHWLAKKGIPCYGHIGANILHPVFRDAKQRDEMLPLMKQLGGKLGAEYGYGILKKEYLGREEAKRIHALKANYDSKNILNRGKLI